uniref:Uncharacterized protein n=1 Tax=Strigamia maritima TaxID=126957 RepID=T1IRS0_STRMM
MSEWIDKVVIITGAGSGIGAGIAIGFAQNGCNLALVGRNEKNLMETAEKCRNLGLPKDKILCIIADLFIDDDVKSIVTKTINKFGKIHVLVNNAGIPAIGGLPSIKIKVFDDIMHVNVRSAVLLSQEAVPYLIETKGNIVNISSAAAAQGYPKLVTYAMSKAALDHFTRCSAIDLAPKGVRINSIRPGLVDTPIFSLVGMDNEYKNKIMDTNKSKHPMGRLCTIKDISQTVCFLASDNSSFTTGQIIGIDGSDPGSLIQ